jgi:hypothetical protein
MGACTGTGKDGPEGVDLGFLKAHRIPVRRWTVMSAMRRSFRTRRLRLAIPGVPPGLVCRAPLGHFKSGHPPSSTQKHHRTRRHVDNGLHPPGCRRDISQIPRSPPKNPSGAGSGRSEPWRRTLSSIAHSAKAHPPQSLLSERRPDPAEPTQKPAQPTKKPERSGVGP